MARGIKKIDKLVASSFVGPYLLSFFVAQFVLIMQFLWKYIDDILGKGFGVLDMLELIFYFAITQISMALPIAILLSSVMVFGNLSERYELSSLKSAGISLVRIMRPAIYIAIGTACLSLFASNYLKPMANFQFKKRFRIMKAQKSSLSIEQKIFNRDFNGYAIRVDEKLDDGESIKDILVYDHTNSDKSLVNLTKANHGKMYNTEDGRYFVMELNDGISYKEMKREAVKSSKNTNKDGKEKKQKKKKKYPLMRTEFEEWKKVFDMSEFDTEDSGINMNRNAEDMLNTLQLINAIDSVDVQKTRLYNSVLFPKKVSRREQQNRNEWNRAKTKKKTVQKNVTKKKNKTVVDPSIEKKLRGLKKNTTNNQKKAIRKISEKKVEQYQVDTLSKYEAWHETITKNDANNLPVKAVQSAGRRKDLLRNATSKFTVFDHKRERYLLRLNQQYSFAIICIVFLFIGAPLGSIIRKGGYGYPLLVAILFYMLFIISTIMGEKLVRSGRMDPILAAWISNLIVGPVAFWLTIKALRDSKFESLGIFSKIRKLFPSRKKDPSKATL